MGIEQELGKPTQADMAALAELVAGALAALRAEHGMEYAVVIGIPRPANPDRLATALVSSLTDDQTTFVMLVKAAQELQAKPSRTVTMPVRLPDPDEQT
jgi:hypothetical protein